VIRLFHRLRAVVLLAVVFVLGWLGGAGARAYEMLDLRNEVQVLERVLEEERWWHDRRRAELEQLRTTVGDHQHKELTHD